MPKKARRTISKNPRKSVRLLERLRHTLLSQPPILTVVPYATHGSFSIINKIQEEPGVVLKTPRWQNDLCLNMLEVESKILNHLGSHERIVKYGASIKPAIATDKHARYCGNTDQPKGIRLGREVNDLQNWIDEHPLISHIQRLNWCQQAAEAVAYVHSKDVIHCDLRPANFLVTKNLDLRLCDFGGSKLGDLYGRGLPNAGFHDPLDKSPVSRSTDIFGLGSCMYTIMTGHFPHSTSGRKTYEEEEVYREEVERLFRKRQFPDVQNIAISDVILDCWACNITAEDVSGKLLGVQTEEKI
jgi:Protein kinase domain